MSVIHLVQNMEVPIVTYCRHGNYMEIDSTIQSNTCTSNYMNDIKDFSPFNEYFIGEKFRLFGDLGTGTQIYIWNLDEWGSDYTLEWNSAKTPESASHESNGDILIRSRRLRSRPGQISQNVCFFSAQNNASLSNALYLCPYLTTYVKIVL